MSTPRKQRMTIVGLIALVGTTVWIGNILWRIDDWSRDWSTNHAEITVDSEDQALRSPTFPESPEVVAKRIRNWVDAQLLWTLQSEARDENVLTLHLVRRTRLFRFADDIHVHLEPVGEATRLTAESQSRLGKGDLGQNPRNLTELLRGLR